MLERLSPPEQAKLFSAYHAMNAVESGMKLGLGSGSTAAWLVRLLGARRQAEGLDISAAATSRVTEDLAAQVGIAISDIDGIGQLDLTIDGADEFDPQLSLIKGGGGALLREKIVATASDRMIVITDPSKEVAALGAYPLPVEVVRFGWQTTRRLVSDVLERNGLGSAGITLRQKGGETFVTDEGHVILDLSLGRIGDVDRLARELLNIAGVVETGLFIDIADTVVIGAASGEARMVYADREAQTVDLDDTARLEALLAHLDWD